MRPARSAGAAHARRLARSSATVVVPITPADPRLECVSGGKRDWTKRAPASAMSAPGTAPRHTASDTHRITPRTIPRGCAPSAMRTPISRTRRCTMKVTMPATPTNARNTDAAPKIASSVETNRGCATDSRRCAASGEMRTTVRPTEAPRIASLSARCTAACLTGSADAMIVA